MKPIRRLVILIAGFSIAIVTAVAPARSEGPPAGDDSQETKKLNDLIESIRELSDDVQKTTKDAFAAWPPYTWRDQAVRQPLPG